MSAKLLTTVLRWMGNVPYQTSPKCAVPNITKIAPSMYRSVLQRLSWSVTPAKLQLKNFHMQGVIIAIKCGCTMPSRAMIMYMNGQLKGHLWTPQIQTAVFNISCLKFSYICASEKQRSPVRRESGDGCPCSRRRITRQQACGSVGGRVAALQMKLLRSGHAKVWWQSSAWKDVLSFCEIMKRWNVTRFCFILASRRIRKTFSLHLNLGLDSSIVSLARWRHFRHSLTVVGSSELTNEILCQLATQHPLRLISRMFVAVITK